MTLFFDVCFLLFIIVAFPKALKRRLSNSDYKGMFQRRLWCKKFKANVSYPVIWLNGVSVGEVVSLTPLVKEIEKGYPGIELIISATTGTGYRRACALFPQHNIIGYPFDLSFIVRLFLWKLKPALVISAELDLWPNFLSACKKKSIPYMVVSGRISERSARGYEKIKILLSDSLSGITHFLAQDKLDASRAIRMGINESKVEVCGNLKFDLLDVSKKELPEALDKLEKKNTKYFVCSSTHDPEEKHLLSMLKKIEWGDNFKDWKLILVPRHPERSESIEKTLLKEGFSSVRYSELEEGQSYENNTILVDKIGILPYLYQFCDLCYIGGSLIPHGAQNMIEPASMGVPVLMGPYLHTFREASTFLLAKGGAIKVNDIQELKKEMLKLLANSENRLNIGTKARDIIAENRGVASRTYSYIEKILKG